MDITFLEASVPLQKTYYLEDGEVKGTNYPMVRDFTTHTYETDSLEEIAELMISHAKDGHSLLKGTVTRELCKESRAGNTNPMSLTQWVCLDLDGVKDVSSVNVFLTRMGLNTYSHIIQYSSSMGVYPDKGLSAHVIFMLEEEVLPSALKEWLKSWNFAMAPLNEAMSLTRDKNQLKWPLDITVCQNDKIIFITPPKLERGVKDHFEGDRITFVQKRKEKIPLSALGIDKVDPDANKALQDEKLNELRAKEGLAPRENKTRTYRDTVVLADPDRAVITGHKEERGFVYLNLNGGKRWAYYHPVGNPHVISTFKDNSVSFATKDLVPEYYESAKERAKQWKLETESLRAKEVAERNQNKYKEQLTEAQTKNQGVSYFVANDRERDAYYTIIYDHDKNDLNYSKTASRQKLYDFMLENGQEEPAFIPNWQFEFKFGERKLFNPETQWVNLYRPTEYLLTALEHQDTLEKDKKMKRTTKCPPTIERVIRHVLGDDDYTYKSFINWVAFILQRREPPRTAWLIQGIQGTGKGTLFNQIFTPLLGNGSCPITDVRTMESEFNGWLENAIIALVDESQTEASNNEDTVLAKMKMYVTEPFVTIRSMRTDHRKVKNNCSFLVATNKHNGWKLEASDRRFHVAPYQWTFLDLSSEDIAQIETELEQFALYLMEVEVDERMATRPIDSEHKREMKHVSQSAIEQVSNAITEGNVDFFVERAPRDYKAALNDPHKGTQIAAYAKFIDDAIKWAAGDKKTPYRVHRDVLQIVINYLVGTPIESPHKFTSYLKHHGLVTKPMRIDGIKAQGIEVRPNITDEVIADWAEYKAGPGADQALAAVADISQHIGKNKRKLPSKAKRRTSI